MPRYRYIGKTPMFYGSQYVEFGMEVELSDRPNRLFEIIYSIDDLKIPKDETIKHLQEFFPPEFSPKSSADFEFIPISPSGPEQDLSDSSILLSFQESIAIPEVLRNTINTYAHTYKNDVNLTPRDCYLLYRTAQYISRTGTTALEFAGGRGFTTQIILLGGPEIYLYTCEKNPQYYSNLKSLIGSRGILLQGDMKNFLGDIPDQLDLLIIDAEHTSCCAQWYIENLWPKVRQNGFIWLHDMVDRPYLEREYATVRQALVDSSFKIIDHTLNQSISIPTWEDLPNRNPASVSCAMVLQRKKEDKNKYFSIQTYNLLTDYFKRLPQYHTYSLLDTTVLYNIIRQSLDYNLLKTKVVLEIGGGEGCSTFIIGLALRDSQQSAHFISTECDPGRYSLVREALYATASSNYKSYFWKGLVENFLGCYPEIHIDALVIDASHTANFARWYIEYLWPRVNSGGMIFIHDIYPGAPGGETEIVMTRYPSCGLVEKHNTHKESLPPEYISLNISPFYQNSNFSGQVSLVLQKRILGGD